MQEKSEINHLTLQPKELEKVQLKCKYSWRKETVKIKAEINRNKVIKTKKQHNRSEKQG